MKDEVEKLNVERLKAPEGPSTSSFILHPSSFLWILLHRARIGGRWIWENAFTLFVMGPLILGGAGLIFQPTIEAAARVLREGADGFAVRNEAAAAGALFALLLVARFSGTVRDVYALDGADHYLDGLPVPRLTRFHVALVVRILKAAPLAAAALFVQVISRPPGASIASTAGGGLLPLVASAVALGVVETAVAIVLVRLRVLGAVRLVVFAVLAVVSAALLADWLGRGAIFVAFAAYPIAAFGYVRWRTEDRERAREALARARRTPVRFERIADRMLGPCAGAQLLRDLRLVRRGFSTTAYIAAAAAILIPGLAVWAANQYGFTTEWLARVVESATILSSFALATITHALVHYERPRVWIDLTSGAEPSELPRAKRWTGRILAVPAAGLGWAAALAAGLPLDPMEIFKLAFLVWATATLTSVLCYEVAERPAAGLVLSFLPAVGISLMFVFYPSFSGIWFAMYYYVSTNLFERARHKVAVLTAE
jgi:hypothetical protein